ncbi:hypothetical protein ABIA54_000226 [Pseudomonas sp. EB276 TE3739]|uniref:hypothetical protein n=1 Tax=Pseudomonas TaxID=286 RepID=UPI0020A0C932|nr:hypothetical protein [Pseudomonas koreensis]MCP1475681.1 hypothetical protein [Pseudomonas koreensis]
MNITSGGRTYNSLKQKSVLTEKLQLVRNARQRWVSASSESASRQFKKPIRIPVLVIITHTFLTL